MCVGRSRMSVFRRPPRGGGVHTELSLLLFQWATLLDGLAFLDQRLYHTERGGGGVFADLVPFQGVLTGESLSTGLAQERFVTGVGIPVAF